MQENMENLNASQVPRKEGLQKLYFTWSKKNGIQRLALVLEELRLKAVATPSYLLGQRSLTSQPTPQTTQPALSLPKPKSFMAETVKVF